MLLQVHGRYGELRAPILEDLGGARVEGILQILSVERTQKNCHDEPEGAALPAVDRGNHAGSYDRAGQDSEVSCKSRCESRRNPTYQLGVDEGHGG